MCPALWRSRWELCRYPTELGSFAVFSRQTSVDGMLIEDRGRCAGGCLSRNDDDILSFSLCNSFRALYHLRLLNHNDTNDKSKTPMLILKVLLSNFVPLLGTGIVLFSWFGCLNCIKASDVLSRVKIQFLVNDSYDVQQILVSLFQWSTQQMWNLWFSVTSMTHSLA